MSTTVHEYAVSAPTGKALRARLYNPDGTTLGDIALSELPAGSGNYEGSAAFSVADALTDPYLHEVREVLAQTGSAFTASTTVWVGKSPFFYARSGVLLSDPGWGADASGSGPYAVRITVTSDGTTPILGASVKLKESISYVATTNSSGVAAMSVVAGGYQLTISKAGYAYTPTTVTVTTADVSQTVTLVALSVPAPPDITQATAVLDVYDVDNNPVSGVRVQIRLEIGPGVEGHSFTRDPLTLTSPSGGRITTPVLKSSTYLVRREKGTPGSNVWGDWVTFVVGNGDSQSMPEVLGRL